MIDSLHSEVNRLKEEKKKLELEKKKAENNSENFEGQVSSYLERICYVLERYKALRKEIMFLREENRVLTIKLENCGEDVKKVKPKFIQQKFKIRSLKDLSTLMAKDPILNLLKFKESDLTSHNIKFGRK
jgi:chromosome segregation ATPase